MQAPVHSTHLKNKLSGEPLGDYFHRIGFAPPHTLSPDLETLRIIHRSHVTTIPFENLNLLHPVARHRCPEIKIDLDSAFDKLVKQMRGGYCFEHNVLLAAVLRGCGYSLYEGAGRVVCPPGMTDPGSEHTEVPMTGMLHMVLFVELPEGWHLCDAGGTALLEPLPLQAVSDPSDCSFRGSTRRLRRGIAGCSKVPEGIAEEQLGWYTQRYSRTTDSWVDLYWFSTLATLPQDFEVANWYCATHPRSFFKRSLMVSLQTVDGRITLKGSIADGPKLAHFHGDREPVERQLAPDNILELDEVLSQYFGITF